MKGEYKIGRKEYHKIYDEERHKKDPERRWRFNLSRLGITPAVWNDMFEKQKGCCAICGKSQSEMSRKLDVDHNHTTGKVRSLLCSNCNKNVGVYEIWNRQIQDYLIQFPQ